MEDPTSSVEPPSWVPGYETIRTLSERDRSKIFLTRSAGGSLVALKVELAKASARNKSILSRYQILKDLAKGQGLMPILDFGEGRGGWIWHTMPLADNLPGLAPLTTEEGLQHYTPMTLAAWIVEKGPSPALQVARWGKRIADALRILHEVGLVHRDVKPTNLLFVSGELSLADYGLVGAPGSEPDFAGTQGFIPIEGTSELGADLFALGKSLYECWSARDRLEFPSLPLETTAGDDWTRYGRALNAVILRASHSQPSRRYRSAQAFSQGLEQVLSGRKRLNRRRWLATAAALSVIPLAVILTRRFLGPATAVWHRVRKQGFLVESWAGHAGTVDWKRGKMYSICQDVSAFTLHTLDLKTFELTSRKPTFAPNDEVASLLHPISGKLWAVPGGRGEVLEIDVDSGQVRQLGGGPNTKEYCHAALYWNAFTGRIGSFGGYGNFRVRNSLHEFREETGEWVETQAAPGTKVPWPRSGPRPPARA